MIENQTKKEKRYVNMNAYEIALKEFLDDAIERGLEEVDRSSPTYFEKFSVSLRNLQNKDLDRKHFEELLFMACTHTLIDLEQIESLIETYTEILETNEVEILTDLYNAGNSLVNAVKINFDAIVDDHLLIEKINPFYSDISMFINMFANIEDDLLQSEDEDECHTVISIHVCLYSAFVMNMSFLNPTVNNMMSFEVVMNVPKAS